MNSTSAIEAPNPTGKYARALLTTIGASSERLSDGEARHPEVEWAESGAMALTGSADGPPLHAPGPLASTAAAAIAALSAITRDVPFVGPRALETIDGPALLGERAALAGLCRAGTTSPGGSCHLLRTGDGWIAVNLAREEDIALLPAWLEQPSEIEGATLTPRDWVADSVRRRTSAPLVERARLLGLPVVEAARAMDPPVAPFRIAVEGPLRRNNILAPPRVVDLSSLWAGPLATHLLTLAGARVIKVESTRRPDGARRGPAAFYDLLNAGKDSVALDFTSADDRRALQRLIAGADIVVEASRPRALRALGIDADEIVASSPGLVWVSITGYGRREPEGHWVAFGDDAGVAAGLAMALAGADGVPVFCSDAIADPLAGLHAAVAALAFWRQGRSVLLDIALRDVAAYAASFPSTLRSLGASRTVSRVGGDAVVIDGARVPVRMPRARAMRGRAAALGADTLRVLAELEAVGC